MRIRKQQRMESLSAVPAVAHSNADRQSESSRETIPYCLSRSRGSSNWLDKLRASKGFPVEPNVAIEEVVKALASQDDCSGDSKSGLTAALVTSASNPCNATNLEDQCSMQKTGWEGDCKAALGDQKPRVAEDLSTSDHNRAETVGSHVAQSEQCDSFDPDSGSKAGTACMNILHSSESQVCPSEGSSQNAKSSSGLSELGNADGANVIVTANKSAVDNRLSGDFNQYAYAFGLPPTDFELSLCGYGVSKKHKRKQVKPRSCPKPYDSPGQEVTGPLLQRRGSDLMQTGNRNGSHSSDYMQERGSPESGNPNPSCRMQLALLEAYGTAPKDCSDEKKRGLAARSASCQDETNMQNHFTAESEENRTDSTSESLMLQRKGIRTRSSRLQVDLEGAGHTMKRRRELYHGASRSGEGQSVERDELMAQLRAPRRKHQSNGLNGMLRLPLDHPACQPKDTLVFSVYQVFLKAGKIGLTAREAVSKILEEGLPGLHECGVVPRVEVGKIVRTSPYFMELEESKFVLCSAITGMEEKLHSSDANPDEKKMHEDTYQDNQMQNWAAFAVRRARTGKTRRKQSLETVASVTVFGKPVTEEGRCLQPRKRRLKSVQQDSAGLGNRCNRSDGKGWHCPLLAQVGYLLCDHHLDRLRAKSGSKGRRPNRNRVEKRNARNTPNGRTMKEPWVKRKSLTGRSSMRHKKISEELGTPAKEATESGGNGAAAAE